MTDRKSIFLSLRAKMESAGFEFDGEQIPHRQKRKEKELKFIHPMLKKQFEENGHEVKAEKFYIKPLSDLPDCEIGLVTGKTSPLLKLEIFTKPNAIDTYGDIPAWVNRENDTSLDDLLQIIENYIEPFDYFPDEINDNIEIFEGLKKKSNS